MLTGLDNFIDNLAIPEDQKDHLRLLIEEEREDLLKLIRRYLDDLEAGEGNDGKSDQEQVESSSNDVELELNKEMEKVTEVLTAVKKMELSANESYNKLDMLLNQKELWLAGLVEKLSKMSNEVSDNFIKILSNARQKLEAIDQEVDQSWQEFQYQKKRAQQNLIKQVVGVRDDQKKNNLAAGEAEEKITRWCAGFNDFMKEKSDQLVSQLDGVAVKIEELTHETTVQMKDVTKAKKLAELEEQISLI